MTVFSNNPYDRRMERLMMTVPNFAPRGVGFRFTEAQLFITTTAAIKAENKKESARLTQVKGRPFSLLWGKKCGFYAMPRKKKLRNRWIYAII